MGVRKNKFAITNHSVFVKVFFGTPVVKKRLQKKKRTQKLLRETSKTFVVVVLKSYQKVVINVTKFQNDEREFSFLLFLLNLY
jgi:hypothetical protein